PGSDLSNVIFSDAKSAYSSRDYDSVKSFVSPTWKKDLFTMVDRYVRVFGRENFFIEVQAIDEENFIAAQLINKTLRWLSKQTGIKACATADSHYVEKKDNKDQYVVLSSYMGKSIPQIIKSVVNDDDDL